jgi:hypothetical protein
MGTTEIRSAIITYLEGALQFADKINDATTGYLIERALDEARAKQMSDVPPIGIIH